MSKSRLLSGKQKKKTGAELDGDRYQFLDAANSEPDLGIPPVNDSVLIGDTDGTRTWTDITTYANDFKGYTGSVGYTGSQGAQGNFGGVTFDYTFDTDITNSAPGTGKLKFNQSNISTAQSLYIQDVDDNNTNLDAYLTTIDASTSQLKGHVRISNKANSNDFAIFAITANSVNNSTYFSVPVTYVSGSANSFSNSEDIIVTFARTGDKGDIGYTGSMGFTGSQGVGFTGSQGANAANGAPGYTGSQGDIGYAGSRGTSGFTGSAGTSGTNGTIGVDGFTGSQGEIGFTGSQGGLGFTGSQGEGYTGSRGDSGFTGSQGGLGYAGSAGAGGTIGYTGSGGALGYTGSKGLAGNFGGATFGYNFNTTTSVSTNPGSGKFAVNNVNLSTTNTIAVNRFDIYSNDLKAYLLTLADSTSTHKGYLKFTSQSSPQYFTFYSITGSVVDNTAWVNLTISYVSGSTAAYANNEDMFLTFSRTGDGGSGYTGSKGYTGSQGIAGEFAALGYAGSRGYTGSAGTDGTSVEIVGTVASSANLPNPYNGSVGDGYITSDTGNLHIWSGSVWTNVGRILGYTGSAGPAGGYTGSAGTAGPLGYTGSVGAGYTGSQGISGSLYVNMAMTGVITSPFVGTSRFYPPKNISIYTVYANLTQAATAGAFTFILKKNGTGLGTTFSITQAQTVMNPTNINVSLLTTDYLTLDVTGASATDLFVKIEYINT